MEKEQTEFQKRLYDNFDGGLKSPAGLRCLANRLWEITHGPQDTVEQKLGMLNDLCFVTGIAMVQLLELAKEKEEENASV